MTEDVIQAFILEELTSDQLKDALTDDYPILDRQVLDSLGLFQLVAFLESEYEIEIDDEELVPANFGSIQDVSQLVETKRSKAEADRA